MTDHPALADRVVDLLARHLAHSAGQPLSTSSKPTPPPRRTGADLVQVITTELETTPEVLPTIHGLLPGCPRLPNRRIPCLPVIAIGLAINQIIDASG
ncbi:hypothetical protein ACOBQX_19595 [Actinokineospora sp. G85]|uniref:hypothetical protein n=1 Tax=Actinokineospora sp. G85 TaxID=3406626 RepID=UPI003C760083